ncbi:unnamed protein product [Phytomonas sp. Hart1]|nr:unnamed protein product [Phytomonas sp. Hart1]|eukprot:CCW70316.1 unnamed protein product [Phytomonas sp. isolate Hart1]
MNRLTKASNTQESLDEWVKNYPSQFSTSSSPAARSLSKGEHYVLRTTPKSVHPVFSSGQQEHLLELYLKLGGVYQSGLKSILYNFLGLTLPSSTANTADRLTMIQEKAEFRDKIGNVSEDGLYNQNGVPRKGNSCKEVQGVRISSDLLQPQEWLDLVQDCWQKQGCPPLQPPPSVNLDDRFRESEYDIQDRELCSSPFSSSSRHLPQDSEGRCIYHILNSTAEIKTPNKQKGHYSHESCSSRLPSPAYNELDGVPIKSCVSLYSVRDVVVTLFRRCGGDSLNESREDSTLSPGTEGNCFITLDAWKRTMKRYADYSSDLSPEPIIVDATNAMIKLLAFPEKGHTQPKRGHTYSREASTNKEDNRHSIIMVKDFTELLRGQLCMMQRDGVVCLSSTQPSSQKTQHTLKEPKLSVSYCSSNTRRRPPTLCMLLAWMDPSNMSRIVGAEGTTYLRSVGLMEAALRFLIVEAQMQLEALTDSLHLMLTAKPPNPPSVILENETTSPLSGTGRRGGLTASSAMSPSKGSSLLQCANGPRKHSGILENKEDPTHSTGPRGNFQRRYLTPRPADEITASVVARAHARRLLDTLRKNTVPILRYECYAVIGGEVDLKTRHTKPVKPTKPPLAVEPPVQSARQFFQKEMPELSMDSSDQDLLSSSTVPPGSLPKSPISTPVRATVPKSSNSVMFQFSGILGNKIPKKACKALIERLSRPVCDVNFYRIPTPTPPLMGMSGGEGGKGELNNDEGGVEASPTPQPPTRLNYWDGQRQQRGKEGLSLSIPRNRTKWSDPLWAKRTKGTALSYADGPIPPETSQIDRQGACLSSSQTSSNDIWNALKSTFPEYSVNPKPPYGSSVKGNKTHRVNSASIAHLPTDQSVRGYHPSGCF